MARKSSIADLNCGMAQTAHLIGDRWTLLILWDAFNGVDTFDAFKEHLGLSTSVLSAELAKLVEAGVLSKRASPEDKRSHLYKLTEKGFALYPVIVAMSDWGERWRPHENGPRVRLIEKATGLPVRGAEVVSASGVKLDPREVRVEAGPGADAHVLAFVDRPWRRARP